RYREIEFFSVLELWCEVGSQHSPLQRREARLHTDGVAESHEVQPAQAERYTGRKRRSACRRTEIGVAAADPAEFRADTSIDRITARFFKLIENALLTRASHRILKRPIHLGEDA